MHASLSNLLQYKNAPVLHRYCLDYAFNKLKSEQAFEELLKFLWLNQKHEADKLEFPDNPELKFVSGIHKEIDDMWHTFILFTQDYADFCQNYFGQFVHHKPTSEEERMDVDECEPNFNRFLHYVRKHLGDNTAELWFSKHPAAATL